MIGAVIVALIAGVSVGLVVLLVAFAMIGSASDADPDPQGSAVGAVILALIAAIATVAVVFSTEAFAEVQMQKAPSPKAPTSLDTPRNCAPAKAMFDYLRRKHSEAPIHIAAISGARATELQVWAKADNSTWTALSVFPQFVCISASGRNWQTLERGAAL